MTCVTEYLCWDGVTASIGYLVTGKMGWVGFMVLFLISRVKSRFQRVRKTKSARGKPDGSVRRCVRGSARV